MKDVIGFIDESGNHDLEVEKNGASSYFIVSAVLVESKNLMNFEKRLERLREAV